MSTRSTPWESGTPSWAGLTTSDPRAARGFYADVLGWRIDEVGSEADGHAVCTRDGLGAASIAPTVSPAQPTAWTTYLAVDDADKIADSIVTHGGTVLLPPTTVGDEGRTALALDPTGAVFGLWQAGRRIGAQVVNEAGALTWNDHHSADPSAARAFYAKVFGYTYTPVNSLFDYATISGLGPGEAIGGIGSLDPELSAAGHAYWSVHFGVADTDVAVTTASALGGRVLAGPASSPAGRRATLADPQGAVFKIIELGVGGALPRRSS